MVGLSGANNVRIRTGVTCHRQRLPSKDPSLWIHNAGCMRTEAEQCRLVDDALSDPMKCLLSGFVPPLTRQEVLVDWSC